MMASTHIAFALLLGLITLPYTPLNHLFYITLIIASSFIPDIDCATSTLGSKFKLPGYIFEHRGIFHSLIAIIVFGYLLSIYVSNSIVIACILGYSSHLIADMLNKKGVTIFYPLKLKIRGFIEINSLYEIILLVTLIVIDAGLIGYLVLR